MLDLKIVCEDEKYMPTYANKTDACMDLKVKIKEEVYEPFASLLDQPYMYKQLIRPNESVVLGTGIKVAIPEGFVMIIFPRSSTGIKLHCMLSNTTGIIDAGYRDEIKMAITNFGDVPIKIEDGQRLAQFMVVPRPKVNLIPVADDDNFRNGDRGGGIGSTGRI